MMLDLLVLLRQRGMSRSDIVDFLFVCKVIRYNTCEACAD